VTAVDASAGTRRATRSRLLVLAIVGGLTAGVTIAALRVNPFGIVVYADGSEALMDFASHREFACAAWAGDSIRGTGQSIYGLEAHLHATERWTHRAAGIALPFGYSPTMLWVLGPTCAVAAPAAFVLWVAAGFVALAAVAIRGRLDWTALLPLATPLGMYTVAHGQTAVLATAGFLALMVYDRGTGREGGAWMPGTVLWLLGAKPPLAVTAAVALFARRRWRPVVFAVALTVISTVLVVPWLGPGWLHDYATLLGRYDRVRLPPEFAWSIVPKSMSNLRAALSVDLGMRDDHAVEVCTALWWTALAGFGFVGWFWSLDWSRSWSIAVLVYLLLCAHVSATENLLLACVIAALGTPRAPSAVAIVVLVCAGIVLAPAVLPPYGGRPSVLFFAMLAVLWLLVRDGRIAAAAR